MADKINIEESEVIEIEPTGGSNRYKLPYGLAKGLGLNTDGMTPREVWDMLKKHGVNPDNEYEKLKEKATTQLNKKNEQVINAEEKLVKDKESAKEALTKIVGFNSVTGIDKMDEKLAVANVKQLIALEDAFGIVAKSEGNIIVEKQPPDEQASVDYFVSEPTKQTLNVSEEEYNSYEKHIETIIKERDNGYTCDFTDENADKYVFTHEYGHMIKNYLLEQAYLANGWDKSEPNKFFNISGRTKEQIAKWYYNIEEKTLRTAKKEIVEIAKTKYGATGSYISRYGTKNGSEWFAEVFASSRLGRPTALGKAMTDWLKNKGVLK